MKGIRLESQIPGLHMHDRPGSASCIGNYVTLESNELVQKIQALAEVLAAWHTLYIPDRMHGDIPGRSGRDLRSEMISYTFRSCQHLPDVPTRV
jgi:hypothetical protein